MLQAAVTFMAEMLQ